MPAAAHPKNNFDALRLGAALLVILGHEFSVRGLEQPVLFGSHIASLGVKIFFCLSGYLIAQSFERDPHAGRFILRRALRIMPGLTLCVLATVFVLGPLASPLGVRAYFQAPDTLSYLWNMAFGFTERMQALFGENPLPHAVNGSLWSLPAEAAMYAILLAGGLACAGRRRAHAGLMLAVFAACVSITYGFGLFDWPEIPVYGTRLSAFCAVASFFCAGALLWQLRAALPLRLDVAGALALAAWSAAGTLLSPLLDPLALSYGALAIGLRSAPGLCAAGRCGDFSYGLYLFAYPVQQLVQQSFASTLDFVPAFALSLAATLGCAVLSWHGVEKRFLRWKPSAASAPPAGARLGSWRPSPPAGRAQSAAGH